MMQINVSIDFGETPGARYRSEGAYSGEEFRDDLLLPKYKEAKQKGEKLLINLDGSYGYPTSFLEEAFGGLARIYGPENVLSTLEFLSEDEPSLVDEIICYIKQAKQEKNSK